MKTARILSIAALATALAGAVIISGWAVFAQDDAASPEPSDEQVGVTVLDAATLEAASTMPLKEAVALLEPLRQQAKQAMETGQYEAAAEGYLEYAIHIPPSPRTAKAILLAGVAYDKAGRSAEAKQLYDQAVEAAKELLVVDYSDPVKRKWAMYFKTDSSKDVLRRSLQYKAEISNNMGDTQGAWSAIRQFRAEEPEYHYLRNILPLQAELQGVSASELVAQEQAAWKLSDQAKLAWRAGDADRAHQIADQVIGQYSETGAALLARNLKARMLWRAHRYGEARILYQDISDRVAEAAPDCHLAIEASWHLAILDATALYKSQGLKSEELPQAVISMEWQNLRNLCTEVMRKNPDPICRAHMHGLIVESYGREDKWPEALASADEMPSKFNSSDPEIKRLIGVAQNYAARALSELGRHEEALGRYRSIVDMFKDDPNGWSSIYPLERAYFGILQKLEVLGDKDGETATIEAILSVKAPESRYRYLLSQ